MAEELHIFNYDVFISFRGEDTRHTFVKILHKELKRIGIITFTDDGMLKAGNVISPALSKAIEESMVLIIVLSENYASSTWCLDELVKILECSRRGNQQLVYPIFYHVDPSHVRHQTGEYGEAMAAHENRFGIDSYRIQAWRSALNEVCQLKGHHISTGNENNIVEEIVKNVSKIVYKPFLGKDPVGFEQRIEEVKSLLDMKLDDDTVCMLGIYGLGGIGKTEIAKALFSKIAHKFEAAIFIENVREKSNNIIDLQKTLLSNMFEVLETELNNTSRGICEIKSRLGKKKILLVLDDVDDREQLNNLAGGCDWFGSGSRIIITTRDEHLLHHHGVQKTYKMVELNDQQSLELFCHNAFGKSHPKSGYEVLSSRAVNYAKGLPLALKALGSDLATEENLEYWECTLEEYKTNLNLNPSHLGSLYQEQMQRNNPQQQERMMEILLLKGMWEGLVEAQKMFPSLDIDTIMAATLYKGKTYQLSQLPQFEAENPKMKMYAEGMTNALEEAKLSFPTLDIRAILGSMFRKRALEEMKSNMEVGIISCHQGSSEVLQIQRNNPLQEEMLEILWTGIRYGLVEAQKSFPTLDIETTSIAAYSRFGGIPLPESEAENLEPQLKTYREGVIKGLEEAKLSFPTLDVEATLSAVSSTVAHKVVAPSSDDNPLLKEFPMMKEEGYESEAKKATKYSDTPNLPPGIVSARHVLQEQEKMVEELSLEDTLNAMLIGMDLDEQNDDNADKDYVVKKQIHFLMAFGEEISSILQTNMRLEDKEMKPPVEVDEDSTSGHQWNYSSHEAPPHSVSTKMVAPGSDDDPFLQEGYESEAKKARKYSDIPNIPPRIVPGLEDHMFDGMLKKKDLEEQGYFADKDDAVQQMQDPWGKAKDVLEDRLLNDNSSHLAYWLLQRFDAGEASTSEQQQSRNDVSESTLARILQFIRSPMELGEPLGQETVDIWMNLINGIGS
ncbi:uncharacterized protein LOC130733253 [Lotus japonicus]|uniref:uncharacterized protein LOC130733253 n=1 Tax=Lotus japonicus TaxID=34305 RepID=UPI00258FA4D3|nr:uncharacterized protein LOC130733253 [Lotus japonicus]